MSEWETTIFSQYRKKRTRASSTPAVGCNTAAGKKDDQQQDSSHHHEQDEEGEQEGPGRRLLTSRTSRTSRTTKNALTATHDNDITSSARMEITRISANPHEDSTNCYEEEEGDSCWSNHDAGRDQDSTSYTNSTPTNPTTTATPPGHSRKTNHSNAGCDVESDKLNGQSDESGEPSSSIESDKFNGQSDESDDPNSNDEDQKQLRQHSDIEKRMEANRLRAKATRRKKKVMIDEIRSKIFVLTVENDKLKNQNRVQQTEIEFLRNIQGQQQQQQQQYLPSPQMLSQPLPPPLPNPMTIQGNVTLLSVAAASPPSDSLPSLHGGHANVLSAVGAPAYPDFQNQLLLFGGDAAQALHHISLSYQQQQNITAHATDLSNSSFAAFLPNAGSGGVNASTGHVKDDGISRSFPALSREDHTQRDRLLLQLLMEKHNKTDDI